MAIFLVSAGVGPPVVVTLLLARRYYRRTANASSNVPIPD
jgi:hypothetical protein